MTDNHELGFDFPAFAFEEQEIYVLNTAYIMTGEKLKFLLGVLNSKLWKHFIKFFVTRLSIRQFRMLHQYLINVPIPKNIQYQKLIEDKVSQILKNIENHSKSDLERQIDHIVYELYGLTDEEIRFIESKN